MPPQKPKTGNKLVDWLFKKQIEIPDGWQCYNFKELLSDIVGGTPLKPEDFVEEGFPVLHKGDIKPNNKIVISDVNPFCTNEFAEDYKDHIVDKSYLVVTLRDLVPSGPTIGLIAQNDSAYLLAQGAYGFHVDEKKINPNFLIQLSNSGLYRKFIKRQSVGSTQIHVRTPDFLKMKFWLPSIPEQQKIESILSHVDNMKKTTDQVLIQTQRLKKATIQKLLTKGISHKKFKKIKYLFKDFFIDIPDEWKQKKLIDLCKEKPRYGAGASAINKDEKLARYIRITDLNDDGTLRNDEWKSITDKDAESFCLQVGDFLFARTGATVGKTYLYKNEHGKCAFAGYLIKFVPNKELLLPEFLLYYTQSFRYRQWLAYIQTWGVQPNINASLYSSMPISIPTINEQKQIVSILFDIDSKIQNQVAKKSALKLLKKGLMQNLFTGKI